MEGIYKKILAVVLLVFLAVFSILVVGDKATAFENEAATAAAIDDNIETVLKLAATSTLTSAGVSVLPGDAGTPIAEKLADFTEYFMLILCVLYAEKYLLAVLGIAAFKILIPCACAFLAVSLFWNPAVMKSLAAKVAVFAIAIYVAIPLSLKVSEMIYIRFDESVQNTIQSAETLNDSTSEISEADGDQGIIASILQNKAQTMTTLKEKAAKVLNSFVESLAVMIVTSCIMPILVLLFFIWLIKLLTGIDLSPVLRKGKRRGGKPPETESNA